MDNPSNLPPEVPPAEPQADPEAIGLLRRDLAGFTVDGVTDLLGPVAQAALGREQPVPARVVVQAAMAQGEPLATLVAAFVLGLPVTRRRLDAALPGLLTTGARRLGLVSEAGAGPEDEVRPLVDLRPYAAVDAAGEAHWWVMSDLGETAAPGPLRADHVLGVGGASTTLARCTLRRPVHRALDIGTGCGVQALHASRHARSVTATDSSPRALAFARFTLLLNGIPITGPDPAPGTDHAIGRTAASTVTLCRGDLLAPVTGRQFDLVISNPPFVITPRRPGLPVYDYRDGGREGDDVVRELVTGVGEVLAPGGVAQFLGNWEHRRGQQWDERLQEWIDQAGLDAWVVQRAVQDPAEYAELWIRDGGRPDDRGYRRMYQAWLADFAARGVEAVGFGMVLMRRPADGAAPSLRRLEEIVLSGPEQPLGEHLLACLEAHDWLRSLDDAMLLRARLVVAGDVTEERFHRPGDEHPQLVALRQGGGFARTVRADTALAGFVGACDGSLTVGQVIGALGHLLQVPVPELKASLLGAVRGLVADAMLAPSR